MNQSWGQAELEDEAGRMEGGAVGSVTGPESGAQGMTEPEAKRKTAEQLRRVTPGSARGQRFGGRGW